ncbi:LptE family protein [Gemmatimonas sp.]|uniref:LptE family protein n=1 Tax=Gemmatimonas sp. TaxID=1962908 RepID=UPI0027BA024B|nr:LptE family protein [Gemmatimonas sp.]
MTPSGAASEDKPIVSADGAGVGMRRGRTLLTRRASLRVLLRGCAVAVVAGSMVVAISGCYGFSGGGGLPRNLKTVAIQPFDNQTAAPELQRELFEQLRQVLRDRLNLREAPEAKADLVVRGTIVNYDVDLPLGSAADGRNTASTRRRLQLTIDVEIVESATSRVLLNKKGLSREGQYAEGGEASGRKNAIESILADIVEGVQSQW